MPRAVAVRSLARRRHLPSLLMSSSGKSPERPFPEILDLPWPSPRPALAEDRGR